ncbi:hypothetical protein niasHT_015195 [Heterodera trifolii]|uniref:Cytochrome P450 n=1 Tax=Heterodera trifolii TaxID=157864 RepID=A0ABD2L2A4_9BILA
MLLLITRLFDVLIIVFLLFLLLLGFLFSYNFYFKRYRLPPGPTPLPLVGNLHQMHRTTPEQLFLVWRRQYGDVFTVWMGEQPVVCVVDYAKIMAHFQRDGDAFAGRLVHSEFEKAMHGGVYGLIFTEGDLWREQRRFTLRVLREFGLSKELMQRRILQELQPLFLQIDAHIESDEELNMGRLLEVAVASIINNLLFGYRFDKDNLEQFNELKQLLYEHFAISVHPLTALFRLSPRLFRHLPFLRGKFNRTQMVYRNLDAFFERQIDEHILKMNQLQDNDKTEPTDFVEAFLKEKAKRDGNGGDAMHHFSIEQLRGICNDLWSAGQDTISNTLAWGIAFLIHHPQIQAKMSDELQRAVDDDDEDEHQRTNGAKNQTVTVANRLKLPYTNAVICEIQRVANLAAFNVPRKLSRDVTIDGHLLKAGTVVCPQISAVLMDEKIFENPTQFCPERFLDENGKLKRVNELIPFSIGKRQCLGESLARMELFLFVANLFKQYKFSAGAKMPSLERKMGATIKCQNFTCHVSRNIAN